MYIGSATASGPESSGDEPVGSKQLEIMDETVRSSDSNSPSSGAQSDRQLTEKIESSSPQNLNEYADVGLVRGNNTSYAPESVHQQDTSELPSFSVRCYSSSFLTVFYSSVMFII